MFIIIFYPLKFTCCLEPDSVFFSSFYIISYTVFFTFLVRIAEEAASNGLVLHADARGNRFCSDLIFTNILTWNEAPFCHDISSILFWISSASFRSLVQRFYIILPPKIFTQRLSEACVSWLASQNKILDGFADNLAQKNNFLVHYLLSNPAYDLIVQMSL